VNAVQCWSQQTRLESVAKTFELIDRIHHVFASVCAVNIRTHERLVLSRLLILIIALKSSLYLIDFGVFKYTKATFSALHPKRVDEDGWIQINLALCSLNILVSSMT